MQKFVKEKKIICAAAVKCLKGFVRSSSKDGSKAPGSGGSQSPGTAKSDKQADAGVCPIKSTQPGQQEDNKVCPADPAAAAGGKGECPCRCNLNLVKPDKKPLYLDFQATSPMDPRVLDAMIPYLTSMWGNPHSNHYYGTECAVAVEQARVKVARLIGAEANEIIFTSGATESNNITVSGCLRFDRKKDHFITVQTEHKCILESARAMEGEGFKVTFLPVKKTGLIDLKQLEETISPKTCLVSVMTVNNEIGVIQPITEIGALCEKKNVLFHTDAAQAVGKIPIDVRKQKIRLMSISGHKLYGPKGVGALFISKYPPVNIVPHTRGGGQEFGLRSGTVPTPLVVGFGTACEICQQEMQSDYKWVSHLSHRFREKIRKGLPHVIRNGCAESTYPGCFNLSFTCVEGDSLMRGIKDVAVSSGSACSSSSMAVSYVLKALGIPEQQANGSLRFGIGRFTTLEEIDYTAERCIAQVRKLREMSPLWEMVQEGVDLKTIIWAQH